MGSLVSRRVKSESSANRTQLTRRELLTLGALGLAAAGSPFLASAAEPKGQLKWGIHVSLAPTWFDPAETPGLITPFMILYALHDALVKPMPGNAMAPGLTNSSPSPQASSWCSRPSTSTGARPLQLSGW